MKVKFAHLADCHLGAWRNEKLNSMGYKAFETAINKIIEEKVDFVIISGDLFDVSNPKVEVIDLAVKELKKLRDCEIPTYGVMGSHDFSPSNKSMLRPLITAGLFNNVSQGEKLEDNLILNFTLDTKTNVKLTGLRARKRSLEIQDYKLLDKKNLEDEKGIKIFILHTMLNELKPIEFKDMLSAPKSLLPSNFHYYAGGHLHKTIPEELRKENTIIKISEKTKIIYPGALTPTNFRELEKYKYGGFCLISGDINHETQEADFNVKFVPLKIREIISINFNCDNKTSLQVKNMLREKIDNLNVKEKIVTLRIYGTLSSGKPHEIKTNELIQLLKQKEAYEVLINKVALSSKEYTSIRVPLGKTNEEIENTLIHEHIQKINIKNINKKDLENKIHNLLSILGEERDEGAKVKDYNEELITNFKKIFQLSKEGNN
ncbi:MAG: exonuclease SbcCD subunit D [Candidatus Hermodarchaeota archaeon]